MSSMRQQVLEQLGLTMKDDPTFESIWDAILKGQDVSVRCPEAWWSEAAVLPALVRWKEPGSVHKNLVFEAAEAKSEHWKQAISWSQAIGSSSTSLPRLSSAMDDPGFAGDHSDSIFLVILHSKDQDAGHADALRESLQRLPPPSQVVWVVDEWNDGLRQLASEVLDDPVHFDIEPGMIQRPEAPVEQNNKEATALEQSNKEEADAAALASYMANIICRSQDRELRAAVRAMLPKVSLRKRKAGSQDRQGTGTGEHGFDEHEDAELRAGIAALLVRHHELVRQKPRGNSSRSTAKTESLPVELRCNPGSDSECTDDSEAW
ncbi:Ada [Symbiodinium sp. CCMP2456]|nr:Ada [Symbiodinium sp. CCMP2456]